MQSALPRAEDEDSVVEGEAVTLLTDFRTWHATSAWNVLGGPQPYNCRLRLCGVRVDGRSSLGPWRPAPNKDGRVGITLNPRWVPSEWDVAAWNFYAFLHSVLYTPTPVLQQLRITRHIRNKSRFYSITGYRGIVPIGRAANRMAENLLRISYPYLHMVGRNGVVLNHTPGLQRELMVPVRTKSIII